MDLALRVSVSWGSEKSAAGLVAWVRLCETSVVILTPIEAGPGVRLLRWPLRYRWLASSAVGLGISPHASRSLTKWFHPTRLETRTKESNICASMRVANLYAQ